MREPLLLPIPEAARYVGVGRDTLYRLVNRGEIPAVRIGKRRLVSRLALERWVEMAGNRRNGNAEGAQERSPRRGEQGDRR